MAASLLGQWRKLRQEWHPQGRQAFRQSVYGPNLLDTPGDRTFELCLTGYGPFVAEMIKAYDRAFLFLDIGANLGLFSLIADRHPLCRKVLAFEPLPSIFANFARNIQRNGAGKVEAHCCAISDSGPEAHLTFDPRHSGMSKLMRQSSHNSIRVRAIGAAELSELVGEPSIEILAKIDVEGAELSVLTILRQTQFYPAISAIIIEVSEQNLAGADKAMLLALLASDGFEEAARSGQADHYDAYYVRRNPADDITVSG